MTSANRLTLYIFLSFCLPVLFCVATAVHATEHRALCLWKIEHMDARVYLLGSMHVMKEDMYPLPEPMTSALAESDVIVFEIDLEKAKSELPELMSRHGLYKSPASISDDLAPDTMNLLKDWLKNDGTRLQQVSHMKPWMLGQLIVFKELDGLGFRMDLGLDQYLDRLAREQNKEIQELETVDRQISVLSMEPLETQDLSLKVQLLESHQLEEEVEQLVSAWSDGDADRLYQLATDMIEEYPALQGQFGRIGRDRNFEMAYKIREYLNTKRNYLVIVGALHMGGPDGIVNLLSTDYTVEQMTW